MTRTWIIKNAHTILTMDDTRRELNGHDILLRDGVIAEIGENIPVPAGAEIVDARNAVVTPWFGQYASSPLSIAHTCCARGAGRIAVWLVANPLSDMGGLWTRRDARFCDVGAE
jgi:hypothetical protein